MNIVIFSVLSLHVVTSVLLTGAFSLLLLAGPPQTATFHRWESAVISSTRWLSIAALLSGVFWLAARTAVFEGRAEAVIDPDAILHAMSNTWPGFILMSRLSLLLTLTVFLWVGGSVATKPNWYAARGQAFFLATVALGLFGASGHSAAISNSLWPLINDMTHLVGVGLWVGGLPPLAMLLYAAGRESAKPDIYAIRAIQRFSHLAMIVVLVLGLSGSVSAWLLVESVPGLFGTSHGHLLLGKLTLLFVVLLLAAASRARLHSLSATDDITAHQTARRMTWFIIIETGLVLLLVGFAVAMTITAPARHEEPSWPLPFRLSFEAITDSTTSQLFMLAPLILFILGLALLLVPLVYPKHLYPRSRRRALIVGAIAILACFGTAFGLRPFLVDAYPTSFVTSPIPYQAGSVVEGLTIYQSQNADSALLPLPSVNSSLVRKDRRMPGEIFSQLKDGAQKTDQVLSDEQLWSVVNYLQTANAYKDKRLIGPEVVPEGAWLAASDFPITMGLLAPWQLRDYRGRRMVLLVLYSLPESRARMIELARRYGALSVLGVEVVAVAPTASPERIAELGTSPPVLFPVVTDGNHEITAAYRLLAPADKHTEILIDRQGYIRAIWRGSETGMPEASSVQAQVEKLNEEKAPPPIPELHIH